MDKEIKSICGVATQALIAERLFNNRRITAKRDDIVPEVEVIFDIINFINSQPENITMILDRNIDEFVIPAEFKDFILPNSVRYDIGNRLSQDLLLRENYKVNYNYNQYLNSISRLRAIYRKGSQEDLVVLKDLRKDVSFEDVRDRASFKVKNDYVIRFEGIPFIPIRLKYGMEFFGNHYYNDTENTAVIEFINTLNN